MKRFVKSNVNVIKGNCFPCIALDGTLTGKIDVFPAGTIFEVYAVGCQDVFLCSVEGELYCSVTASIFMKFFMYVEAG